jgi:acetyl-CoA synthetase
LRYLFTSWPLCDVTNTDTNLSTIQPTNSITQGLPKGLVHTTAGYALYAAFTTKTTFDLNPYDRMACMADCGWITGHTYAVYGPLLNGVTTFLFESTPLYPNPGRYWDMVQRHQLTHFYTAPTALRSLMRYGNSFVDEYDLTSLKVLGSVGEPINPEAWRWYYECVGRERCTIVDTYWQTETGAFLLLSCTAVCIVSCCVIGLE